MEMLRSSNLLCLAPFFNQPPYAKREKKHLNIAFFCFCPWRESNLGHQHIKQVRYTLHHCLSVESAVAVCEVSVD